MRQKIAHAAVRRWRLPVRKPRAGLKGCVDTSVLRCAARNWLLSAYYLREPPNMVKIKAISRDRRDCTAAQGRAHARLSLPIAGSTVDAREYTRVNAVKLDRLAKPFVGAEHCTPTACCMAKSLGALSTVSGDDDEAAAVEPGGALDGVVDALRHFVRGLAFCRSGHHFVSASDDCTVKLWTRRRRRRTPTPLSHLGHAFQDVDHHWQDHLFATAGAGLALWDSSRSEPRRLRVGRRRPHPRAVQPSEPRC